MNPFAISGLLIGITALAEALIMFIRGSRKVHYLWGIFSISVMLWGIGAYKIGTTLDPEKAILWWRVAYIGVIFIPVFLIHFLYEFLEISRKLLPKTLYILGIFFLMINFINGLFIDKVRFVFNQFYYISPPTILYISFVAMFFGAVIYTLFKFWQAYRSTQGIKRAQLKYMFIALFVGFLGGGTSFLPVFKIDFYPFLNLTVSFGILIVAYAILKYRLMDIRVVLGRSAVYVFSFAAVIGLAFLLMFLSNLLTQPLSLNVSGPLIIVSLILLFRPIFRFFEKIASKYFYYTFYSYQRVLTNLGKKLTQFLDLGKLSSLITNTLINTMKLDRTVVLLREPETGNYQIQKNIGFREENGISLVKDNFLTIWLERSKKPLVYEELSLIIRDTQDREEKEKLEKLKEDMKRIEANLCLPLFIEEKIIGMIILGNKISREPYSQQDIELLTALSSQSSIAFYNARLYDQVQDLSQNLQKKVDEQTREIKKAYEVEKQAHEELKKLDVAKTQFIRAATHHLRTPLTSIRGYLELILGGSYGKLNNTEIQKKILAVRKSANILQGLIEDILDITLLRTGKAILNLEEIQPEKIIEDIVKEEKLQAKTKGIYLKYQEPKTPLPKIMLDKKRIKEAIYNIVDNAVKYTEKGGITINLKSQILNLKNQRANIRIIVQDTGVGLSEEEQKMFLQGEYFFERGKEAEKLWGPGRGIGLVIAHEFIKAHQGKLWVESAGRGKGSTFYVELPAK